MCGGGKARPQWLKSHEAVRQYHIQMLVEEVPGAWSLAEPSGGGCWQHSGVPGEVPVVKGWAAQKPSGRLVGAVM